MKKKTGVFWVIAAVCLLFLGVVGYFGGSVLSTGYFLRTDSGTCMIVQGVVPTEMHDYTLIGGFEGLQTGDKILIAQGPVMESYPGQTVVRLCIRLERGDLSNIPEQTLEELREIGWIFD